MVSFSSAAVAPLAAPAESGAEFCEAPLARFRVHLLLGSLEMAVYHSAHSRHVTPLLMKREELADHIQV